MPLISDLELKLSAGGAAALFLVRLIFITPTGEREAPYCGCLSDSRMFTKPRTFLKATEVHCVLMCPRHVLHMANAKPAVGVLP